MKIGLIIFAIISGVIWVFVKAISQCVKEAEKEDAFKWEHEAELTATVTPSPEAIKNCPHPPFLHKDIVVDSNVNCETMQTICSFCNTVLDQRTECY